MEIWAVRRPATGITRYTRSESPDGAAFILWNCDTAHGFLTRSLGTNSAIIKSRQFEERLHEMLDNPEGWITLCERYVKKLCPGCEEAVRYRKMMGREEA